MYQDVSQGKQQCPENTRKYNQLSLSENCSQLHFVSKDHQYIINICSSQLLKVSCMFPLRFCFLTDR